MAKSEDKRVDHYGAEYKTHLSDLNTKIRQKAYGEDYGQNGWQTADEQDLFIKWLGLGDDSHLLDIACGSGGPTLRIAAKTGCRVTGVDIHEDGVKAAATQAREKGLSGKATFQHADAAKSLPFKDATFDAVMCIDAINHLPDRPSILAEWNRVLKPGGRLLYTDPIVITGALTDEEMRIRSSIGFFLFVPESVNEKLLEAAGFKMTHIEDRTANMARMAGNRLKIRAEFEKNLRESEGDETFDGQQVFFQVAEKIAAERRLSRFVFVSEKV